MNKIDSFDCFVRLNLSRPEGGFYISGNVELLGRRKDLGIGDKIQIGGLNFYIVNILHKNKSTNISIVSEGKRLQNLKFYSGFKFITMNEGVLYYMSVQNIENPPFTSVFINGSKSPWADDNHFDSVAILSGILSVLNKQYGTNYQLKANFSYGVKDLQVSRGTNIISVIRSIYPFDARFMNLFVYNEQIYLNLFPESNIEALESILDKACLVSFTNGTNESISNLSITGLAGRTGNWSVRIKEEDCSRWVAVHDSLTNKEYIHSKIEEVSLTGTMIDISTKGDIVPDVSECRKLLSTAETFVKTNLKIHPDLEYKKAKDIFDLLTKYALHFQVFTNLIKKETLNLTKYKTLPDFPPEKYTKGIVNQIENIQVVKSPLLEKILIEGKARRKRITDYDYQTYGNIAIKIGEKQELLTDVIVLPNYSTEFYADNELGWNAGSKVRWIDLTNLQQTDVEDLLITLFFKQIKEPIDIFRLLSIDYKQYIRNLVDNDDIPDMKNHTFVQQILSLNLPDKVSHFHQKIVNIIKKAFKFLQDQYIPPVLAIYWADKDMNGFSKDNFEDSVNNNPYYQKLYEMISCVDYEILELVPIQKRIIQYRSLEGKKASKHTLDISLSPTGIYRTNSKVEDLDYRSLITVVKPLSIGSVIVSSKNIKKLTGIERPTLESIRLPSNNALTLLDILTRLEMYSQGLKKKNKTYISVSKEINEKLPTLLNALIFNTAGFNLSIDNKTGLSNLSFIAYEK